MRRKDQAGMINSVDLEQADFHELSPSFPLLRFYTVIYYLVPMFISCIISTRCNKKKNQTPKTYGSVFSYSYLKVHLICQQKMY